MPPVVLRRVEPRIEPRQGADHVGVTPDLRHVVQLDDEEEQDRIEPGEDERREEEITERRLDPADAERRHHRQLFARVMRRVHRPPEPRRVEEAVLPVVDEVGEHVREAADRDRDRQMHGRQRAEGLEDEEAEAEQERADDQLDDPDEHVGRERREYGRAPVDGKPDEHLAHEEGEHDGRRRDAVGPEGIACHTCPISGCRRRR